MTQQFVQVGVELALVRVLPVVAHFSELGFEGLPHVMQQAGLCEQVREFFCLTGKPFVGECGGVVLEMLVAFLVGDGVEFFRFDALGQAFPMFLGLAILGAQQGLQAVMPYALVKDDAGEGIVWRFTGAQFHIACDDGAVAGLGIVEAFGVLQACEVFLRERVLLGVVGVEEVFDAVEDVGFVVEESGDTLVERVHALRCLLR